MAATVCYAERNGVEKERNKSKEGIKERKRVKEKKRKEGLKKG